MSGAALRPQRAKPRRRDGRGCERFHVDLRLRRCALVHAQSNPSKATQMPIDLFAKAVELQGIVKDDGACTARPTGRSIDRHRPAVTTLQG